MKFFVNTTILIFKRNIIGVFLFFYGINLFSQESINSNEANILSSAVGEFTGALNLSLPLASVNSGKLSIPVTLTYVGDGLKPGQDCGPVGLNWVINSHFVIQRIVKDNNDLGVSCSLAGYNYCPTCSDSDISSGTFDGARDLYNYSFGQERGNFYINTDYTIQFLNKTDIKIEYFPCTGITPAKFKVKLQDGTSIFLSTNYGVNAETTFLPVICTSYDAKDTIKYEYEYSEYSTPALLRSGPTSFPTIPISTIGNFASSNILLKKVIGYNDTLEFVINNRADITGINGYSPAVRYNSLTYKTDSTCVKYTFDSDYFEDGTGVKTQLRLRSLKQNQCTTPYDSIPSYYFEYYGPNNTNGTQFCPKKSTTGLDTYGYYNGITTNSASNMIPIGIGSGQANRIISLEPTKTGMLKKVTLPTGGTVNYEYEQNKYRFSDQNKVNIVNLIACDQNTSFCSGIFGDSETVAIDANTITNGVLSMNFYPHTSGTYKPYGYDYVFFIKNSSGSTLHSISFNAQNGNPNGFNKKLADIKDMQGNPVLQAGNTYVFEIISVDGRGTANIERLDYHSTEISAGGVRVSKMIESNLLTSKTTQFIYENGMVYNLPKFSKNNNNGSSTFYMLSDITNVNFLFPYHIGYGKVSSLTSGIGKKVSNFNNTVIPDVELFGNPPAFFPLANSKLAQNIGAIKSVELWDNSNQMIQKDSFEYQTSLTGSLLAQKEVYTHNSKYLQNYYSIQPYDNRIKKQFSYYLNKLIQTAEYTYGHVHTVNPSLVKIITGNDEVTEYWTDYTNNTYTGNQIKDYFIQNNIIIPYTGQTFKNSTSVGAFYTQHSFYNTSGTFVGGTSSNGSDIVRASQNFVYQYNLAGTLTGGNTVAEKYFHSYDATGLPVLQQKLNWPSSTTTYDRKRPISVNQNTFITSTEYIGKGNLIKKKINVDGTYTEYFYDGIQRLKKSVQMPANIVTEYFYILPTPTVPFNSVKTKTTFPVVSFSNLSVVENISYMDKLGRKVADVAIKASPNQKDVITCYVYDSLGRLVREYLPVETVSITGAYYYPDPAWKFKEIKYESSPLSRVKEVIPPDWYATKYDYGLNIPNDNVLKQKGSTTYGIGELIKETVTDGNGNKTITFKDFGGRLILSRQTDASDTPSKRRDTYTHYDNKDRITKVIPPDADSTKTELLYLYTYDDENKLIAKKVPGKGWVNYYYNNKDQIAVEQDAVQASKSTKEWLVSLYDVNGRLLKTGLNQGASIPNLENPTFTKVYTENIYGTTSFEKDKIKTSKVNVLGTTNFLNKTFTYDTRGRVQSFSSNNYINNTAADVSSFIYDNGDNVINDYKPLTVNLGSGNTVFSRENSFTYDHRGRTIEENFKYGSGSVQNIATNVYNWRSDLIQVKQGKYNASTWLQSIDYNYRANGMPNGINQYLGTVATGDLFYEELFYENNISGTTSTSRKNGEISNVKWQRRNATIVGGVHAYAYNEFGELLTNDYYNLTGATTFTNTTKFDETFGYSGKYGKITGHTKKDYTGGDIDILSYNYVSNSPRTANVNDSSGNILGHKQNGQPTSGNVYAYDLNGNQINDPYRGVISITYNFLDLPETIDLGGGKMVVMVYDALGNILNKKIYNNASTLLENRTYISGFEFVAYGSGSQSLEMVHHGQGYYRLSTSKHEYIIKDHLGNTRIVYTDSNGNGVVDQTEILDENHYYAYGMEMSDPTFLNNSIYKYKFNGIERTESIGLNIDLALYRGLDPVLGKWYQVDPYAAAFYTMSPYCAMGNNPVSLVDPDGGWVHIAVGAVIGGAINVATHWDNVVQGGVWEGVKAFAIGAGAGALSAATGGAYAASFGLGTTGIASGLVTGGIGAAYGSIAQGVGNALVFGDEYSLKRFGTDVIGGALIGGVVGGGVALFKGQNIWWGNTVRPSLAPGVTPNQGGGTRTGAPTVDDDVVNVSFETGRQAARFPDGKIYIDGPDGWTLYSPENAAKTSTNAFKHSYKYDDRVRVRGVQDPVSHNFPYSFDDAILSTNPILKNNGYKIFQQSGTMNGKNGVFEIGLTKDGLIDHRFFRPIK